MNRMHVASTCAFIFLMLTFATAADPPFYRYDYVFNELADGWLKQHDVPAPWHEARLVCHAEGAVLASPINRRLLAVLSSFYNFHSKDCAMYTGVHATFSKTTYTSVEGVPLSRMPIKWEAGELDNFNNSEYCLVLLSNATMADVACDDPFPFVCYKKRTAINFITACGTVDDKYELDKTTGSCYKVHKVGHSWSDAFMTCEAEGGYLAIINSKEEAQSLKTLFQKIPKYNIFARFKDGAFIGMVDWSNNSDWYTVQGQTIKEAGYNNWAHWEPSNRNNKHCGIMNNEAQLLSYVCDENLAYICEKSVDSLLPEDKRLKRVESIGLQRY